VSSLTSLTAKAPYSETVNFHHFVKNVSQIIMKINQMTELALMNVHLTRNITL